MREPNVAIDDADDAYGLCALAAVLYHPGPSPLSGDNPGSSLVGS